MRASFVSGGCNQRELGRSPVVGNRTFTGKVPELPLTDGILGWFSSSAETMDTGEENQRRGARRHVEEERH
jgi:hypothetical protein